MYSYQKRLELLTDALFVEPGQVITTLRRKNTYYCNSQGHVLLGRPNLTDEQLVNAAFSVFIDDSYSHDATSLSIDPAAPDKDSA